MRSASKYNKSARKRAQSVPIRMSTVGSKPWLINRTTDSMCVGGGLFHFLD